jgi:hypothetical protein
VRLAHCTVILVFIGCARSLPRAAPSEPQPVGTLAPTSTDTARGADSTQGSDWVRALASTVLVTERPIVSAHIGHEQRAEIRVSPVARAAYLSLSSDTQFPAGTLLAEQLREADSQRSGAVLALERAGSDWRFLRREADGSEAAPASLDFCRRCHAQAPAAPVFGLPRATLSETESKAAGAESKHREPR